MVSLAGVSVSVCVHFLCQRLSCKIACSREFPTGRRTQAYTSGTEVLVKPPKQRNAKAYFDIF